MAPQSPTWACDVKNDSAVRSTIEEIASALGGIDVLINNAGEIVVSPLDAMERKDFQDALDIHFWAPFNVTFASLPHLNRSHFARIVNIASFAARLVAIAQAIIPDLTADLMKVTAACCRACRFKPKQGLHWLGKRIGSFSFFAHAVFVPPGQKPFTYRRGLTIILALMRSYLGCWNDVGKCLLTDEK
jgi:NAD(P)-dependent dehydrogenase (short-subunit alcohol dehydrogenase family)